MAAVALRANIGSALCRAAGGVDDWILDAGGLRGRIGLAETDMLLAWSVACFAGNSQFRRPGLISRLSRPPWLHSNCMALGTVVIPTIKLQVVRGWVQKRILIRNPLLFFDMVDPGD